jgi:thiol-disulfide isomerase/thioredoxin
MNKNAVIAIVAVLFLGGLVGGRYLSQQTQSPAVSQLSATGANAQAIPVSARPDFTLPDLRGQKHEVSEWDGKVLVVNFWATWCAPCRKEIPFFNTLQAKYADKGLQFVGIAVDDAKAVKRFMQVIPMDYTVLIGGDDAIPIAKAYGNTQGVLPFTVFVDREGKIASIAKGGLTEEIAERTIAKLL